MQMKSGDESVQAGVSKRRRNADRTAATQKLLTAAARQIFVRDGFAGAATDEIVRAAKVTRGALYHHYANKEELFRAVIEHEAKSVANEIKGAEAIDSSPREAMRLGSDAYFAAMTKPGRSFLLLTEGPSVLGWPTMGEIDKASGGGELKQGLAAIVGGRIDDQTLDALATLLSAAFDRAVIEIDQGADPAPLRRAIDLIIKGLN